MSSSATRAAGAGARPDRRNTGALRRPVMGTGPSKTPLPAADVDAARGAERETGRPARALTERILDRLGPPRWLWIGAWALTPVAAAGVAALLRAGTAAVGTQPQPDDRLLSTAISSYSIVLLLWGVDRIMAAARALPPCPTASGELVAIDLRRMTRTAAPLLLAAGLTLLATAGSPATGGSMAPSFAAYELATIPLEFAYHVAITSFAWVYVAYLIGLYQLGRRPLMLAAFPEDRGLGLTSLGSVASSGFAIAVAYLVPVTILNASDPLAVVQLVAGVAVIITAFVASMWQLHGQMREAKATYVRCARLLYAEAYTPLRAEPTPRVLRTQAAALGAAQALEQRAQSTHEWPIDEATTARLAIIVTGVVTGVIVRVLGTGLHV